MRAESVESAESLAGAEQSSTASATSAGVPLGVAVTVAGKHGFPEHPDRKSRPTGWPGGLPSVDVADRQ
jgi:hypothetical protein